MRYFFIFFLNCFNVSEFFVSDSRDTDTLGVLKLGEHVAPVGP